MNSLSKLGETVRKIVIALGLLSTLTVAIAAQKVVEPQSQGKMYGEPGFRGEAINLNVVNADVRDILSYITDQYGINFVIDKSVRDVPVTVKVNEVPWNVALDSVLRSQGLAVQVNGSILRVADSGTLASEQAVLLKVRDGQLDNSPLYTEFIRLNYARAEGKLQDVAGTANELTAGTNSSSPVATLYGDVNSVLNGSKQSDGKGFTSSADSGLLGIIQKRMSRRGSIEVDQRSNTLIVTDVRENLDAVRQLVAYLDQPEPQVEIEARIVVASRNFSRDIGVQMFAMLNGANGSGIQGGTLPPNQGTGPGIPPVKTLNGLPAGSGLPLNPANNSLLSSIPNTVIGLTTGIFGTATLSSLITLGEQKGQAKIIASPRITTLNNRAAEIKSGTKIPVTTIQPGSTVGGAIIATTTYVDVPLRLSITPQITDTGMIILSVVAENSSTSNIIGGVAPAINTQSMKTEVTVPDGGTTVVGGVLFDDERESQDRTPGLGGIPILGNLFKRKGVQRNTNEILFFITPRISRPDYATPSQNTVRPSGTIIQPVPLGNPPSNSNPNPPADTQTQPVIFQSPGLSRPEAVQAAPSK
ncbi:MAG: type IV pilus secretin PilQ [Chloracidobacterium sp.]|nr:type IV pilus secretin PilQ [Chloracidobacterium sp.]